MKVTITAVRRSTVRVSPPGVRAACRGCGREVETLTASLAAEILEVGERELSELIAAGRVHAMRTASGGLRVCKESLFPRSEMEL